MIVVIVFPDDSSARMTLAEAKQLYRQTRGLRCYPIHWDGTQDGPNGGPYLSAWKEPRQLARVPALGTLTRTRTINSVATDLSPAQQAAIAEDALRIGTEACGRKWQLSKHSVQRVMQLQGHQKPAGGKWKASAYTTRASA